VNNRIGAPTEQPVTNLAGIVGRWKFENERTVFERPENQEFPQGVCVSNIRFLEGEARVLINRTDATMEGRILLGYRSPAHEYFSVGIGAAGKGYGVVRYDPSFGWRHIARTGIEQDLPVGQPIKFCVKVRGQRILLEVNDVQVLEHVLIPVPDRIGSATTAELDCCKLTEAPQMPRASDLRY
jgi:hypothetical protein